MDLAFSPSMLLMRGTARGLRLTVDCSPRRAPKDGVDVVLVLDRERVPADGGHVEAQADLRSSGADSPQRESASQAAPDRASPCPLDSPRPDSD